MFRRAAIAACGAVLLVGSGLSIATAEASVSHDRAPAPLVKLEKFRHDFSPNKDGFHDQLKIPVTLTQRGFLNIRVLDLDTKTVLAHPGKAICLDGKCRLARGTHTVRWSDIVHVFDRSSYAGDPRGSYRLTFHASTPSGDRRAIVRTLVTWRDPVELDDDAEHSDHFVSPNGDGRQDRLRIGYDVEQSARVRAVLSSREPRSGDVTVVDTFRLGRQTAGHHTWTWSPAQGSARPADGSYSVTLIAVPLAQRPGKGRVTVPVTVDTVEPDATSKRSRTTVYPSTTLFADEIRFQFGEDVSISTLDASVRRPDGVLVRALEPRAVPCVPGDDDHLMAGDCAGVRWDGRSTAGVAQPAGSYVLHAIAYDAAGNRTVAETPLTVSGQPLVEHTKSTTLPAAQWGPGRTSCSYPGPQICTYHSPVASDRFPGGWSFRSGSGPADSIYTVEGDTGHERFRVTATGGPTTPGDLDTAWLSGTQLQGDGTFTTPWIPVTLTSTRLMAQGSWGVRTYGGNDYDVASYTVEQTYFAPAS